MRPRLCSPVPVCVCVCVCVREREREREKGKLLKLAFLVESTDKVVEWVLKSPSLCPATASEPEPR